MIKKVYNYIVYYFRKYIFDTRTIIEAYRPVAKEINAIEPGIKIRVEKFSEKHIELLKNKMTGRKINIFKSRMNNDFYGFVLLTEKNDAAAFGWITFKDDIDPDTGMILVAGANGAVLLDDYTFDEYRGKSLQKYIYRLKLQKLQEMNLEHCRVAYLSDNTYSRKTMLTHGFIETHIWKIIKIAGFSVKRRKEIS